MAEGLAESLIEDEIGCGPFQILFLASMFPVYATLAFAIYFMTYGNYNPGWRCLDDVIPSTNTSSNITVTDAFAVNASIIDFQKEISCTAFDACGHVEFNPESQTLVTEWSLVCERAWISSLIISIFMGGTLLGISFTGQLADSFGRKKILYGFLLVQAVLVGVSAVSPSWQVMTVFQFFIGVCSGSVGSLRFLYPSEFMTKKWRGPISGLPAFSVGGLIFALLAMFLRDWRHILIASAGVGFLSCVPSMWIPESLRWLEVKHKRNEFEKVALKMARTNRKTLSGALNLDTVRLKEKKETHNRQSSNIISPTHRTPGSTNCTDLQQVNENNETSTHKTITEIPVTGGDINTVDTSNDRHPEHAGESLSTMAVTKPLSTLGRLKLFSKQTTTMSRDGSSRTYTFRDLFRRGYRLITVLVAVELASNSIVFYSINFGVKALSGDFYINLILLQIIMGGSSVFPIYAANFFGRKRGSVVFQLVVAVCLISATVLEKATNGDVRKIGTFVFVSVAFVGVNTAICLIHVHVSELYPTVVRGLASSWVGFASRLASMLAPFLIAKDTDSVYLWYLVMGSLALISGCLATKLSETKGQPMKETFDQDTG